MTYQKCPVLLMCRNSISEGFFHTPVRQVPSPVAAEASIEKTNSLARIVERSTTMPRPSNCPTLAYGTRGCWLAPAPASRPLPPPPPLWSARLVPRGGRRAFFGILGRP